MGEAPLKVLPSEVGVDDAEDEVVATAGREVVACVVVDPEVVDLVPEEVDDVLPVPVVESVDTAPIENDPLSA